MFIEAGGLLSSGGPSRVVYNPDGSVPVESDGDGTRGVPTGTIQLIPGGVADGASNGTEVRR